MKIIKSLFSTSIFAVCLIQGALFSTAQAASNNTPIIGSFTPPTLPTASTKPTIILIHGLWADGSAWNKMVPYLTQKGYPVIAVQNSTTSLADDVAATKLAIDRAGGEVILVGHSWGGTVISEAGNDPRVKGLVYVAAFAPETGESLGSLGKKMPTQLSNYLQSTNDFVTLSREGVGQVFAGDVSQSTQDAIFVAQPPAAAKNFDAILTQSPAWKSKPSWYVVAQQDKAIDPTLERLMAKRAHSTVVELSASHVPMLSKPRQVAKAIDDAAISFK